MKRRVRVERIKLQTLRTPRTVACVALLLVLTATLNALDSIDLERPAPVVKGDGFRVLGQRSRSPEVTTRDDVRAALGEWALSALVAFSFGIVAFASERRHQTLAASLLGVRRRRELLAAKVGAVVPYALAVALAALVLDAVLVGGWMHQNDVSAGLDASAWVRIALGGVAATALAAAAGVAVGVFVTAPAGGIVAGLGLILVVEPVLASRSEALARWLPWHALDACFGGVSSLTTGDLLAQGAGLAVLGGWTLLAAVLAALRLEHRDAI